MFLSQVEFLKHILQECEYLLKERNANTYEDFINDERLSKAICRSLEIIGEASSKIDPDIKTNYPLVPWREMSDLRNRIIHHYFGIDYDIVWDVIVTDIPELAVQIKLIIDELEIK
ncbi:HepT-like ribonuclease domain-containing protein [Pedobacter sp. GSP4]|uniref:HepT-like ribonuclease domain-containing protein n=1 Tax=Pedobacter sp. GSP4 TaxID=3453716 RepID=UPI003EEBC80F